MGKIRNSVPKEFMTTPIRVVFKFQGNWPTGSRWNDAFFGDRKFAKCCFFSPPFCARLAEGACHANWHLYVKFRPNRFRFVGVIAEKVISYDRKIMPSAYNKISTTAPRDASIWCSCSNSSSVGDVSNSATNDEGLSIVNEQAVVALRIIGTYRITEWNDKIIHLTNYRFIDRTVRW